LKKRDTIILTLAVLFALGAVIFLLHVKSNNPETEETNSPIQQVSNYNFDETVLKSDKPVLVDFGAQWCPACRMLSPVISSVATETVGKIRVVKIDVDEAKTTAVRYNIELLPTLLIIKDGKEMERVKGIIPRDSIMTLLKKYATL
jgi:thioredoxin 1